jgi:PadR family transcriptional regulator
MTDERDAAMSPTDKPSALVQGTLDMLILKTLALEPMHGYGIGMRLEQISRGTFRVNAGSLFPAFRRLERDGLIEGKWETTEHNRRAKWYSLTAAGRKRLKDQARDWQTQTSAIAAILGARLSDVS